jgi:hypothetical protein
MIDSHGGQHIHPKIDRPKAIEIQLAALRV